MVRHRAGGARLRGSTLRRPAGRGRPALREFYRREPVPVGEKLTGWLRPAASNRFYAVSSGTSGDPVVVCGVPGDDPQLHQEVGEGLRAVLLALQSACVRHASSAMKVFLIGISGAVGRLLAADLSGRGDVVSGLVRREDQRSDLASRGIEARVGDIGAITADQLADLLGGFDAVVYTAGSNGGRREVTDAVDGEGVVKALDAACFAGVRHFALVSVLPEAWRERHLEDDEEHYFAVKKLTDVAVSASDLDWLILRPSLLVDRAGSGRVALGPAQPHDEIAREDVAATLAELLHEPRIRRRILELTAGETPIAFAVRANIP